MIGLPGFELGDAYSRKGNMMRNGTKFGGNINRTLAVRVSHSLYFASCGELYGISATSAGDMCAAGANLGNNRTCLVCGPIKTLTEHNTGNPVGRP